jgi:hypothetical protein
VVRAVLIRQGRQPVARRRVPRSIAAPGRLLRGRGRCGHARATAEDALERLLPRATRVTLNEAEGAEGEPGVAVMDVYCFRFRGETPLGR